MPFPTSLPAPGEVWNLGVPRLFGKRDLKKSTLRAGWSHIEARHVWTDGPEAEQKIGFPLADRPVTLQVTISPFIAGQITHQDLYLFVNGQYVKAWRLRRAQDQQISATINTRKFLERDGVAILNCLWHLPNSARPADLGLGADSRELGLRFVAAKLQ
jgi:hypothetical protein